MNRITGKVTLITGAARGQGAPHAITLATAVDVPGETGTTQHARGTTDDLAETVRQVGPHGHGTSAVRADLRAAAGGCDRTWALTPENLRVDALHPTGMDTDISDDDWVVCRLGEHEDLAEPRRGSRMAADVVHPEDVSKMIVFLVPPDVGYVTGVGCRVEAGFKIK